MARRGLIQRSAKLAKTRFRQPMWNATQVTGREDTERRILLCPMRYGVSAQPAPLVRGSSRRITIVRFRPANIRVINRRTCLSFCHLRCGSKGRRAKQLKQAPT
jgi:hypothetical protein